MGNDSSVLTKKEEKEIHDRLRWNKLGSYSLPLTLSSLYNAKEAKEKDYNQMNKLSLKQWKMVKFHDFPDISIEHLLQAFVQTKHSVLVWGFFNDDDDDHDDYVRDESLQKCIKEHLEDMKFLREQMLCDISDKHGQKALEIWFVSLNLEARKKLLAYYYYEGMPLNHQMTRLITRFKNIDLSFRLPEMFQSQVNMYKKAELGARIKFTRKLRDDLGDDHVIWLWEKMYSNVKKEILENALRN